MKSFPLLLCLSLCLCGTGCSSKEQVYEHLYKMLQMRARMNEHPLDIAAQEQISYDRYLKEKETDREPEPPLPMDFAQ